MANLRLAICHVAHWDQLLGGAELQLSYLAQHYLQTGAEVHTVYLVRNDRPVEAKGAALHPVPFRSGLGRLGRLGRSWFLHANDFRRALDGIQPDTLITRTRTSIAGLCASYAREKRILHRHFVSSDREPVPPTLGERLARPLDMIEWSIYSRIFAGGTRILCQNAAQQELLRKTANVNAEVLPQMAPSPSQNAFKKSGDAIKVVWIANMKALKRPEYFVDIACRLEGRSDIEFVMIGPDEYGQYDRMISAAKRLRNFTYLGRLPNDHVNDLLASSHILVNSSDYEGFSNTFVQAWLRKVVVVSFNANPDGLLQSRGLGMVVGDVAGAVDAIRGLADDREKLARMAEQSRNYAMSNHTFEAVLK